MLKNLQTYDLFNQIQGAGYIRYWFYEDELKDRYLLTNY